MIMPEKVFRFEFKSEGNEIRFQARLLLSSDLPYFSGHFPNNPVLPAVAIIDASLAALRAKHDRHKLNLVAVKLAKFTHPAQPGMAVTLDFEQTKDQNWRVRWSSHDSHGATLSLNDLVLRLQG